jgi:hypothetical protein
MLCQSCPIIHLRKARKRPFLPPIKPQGKLGGRHDAPPADGDAFLPPERAASAHDAPTLRINLWIAARAVPARTQLLAAPNHALARPRVPRSPSPLLLSKQKTPRAHGRSRAVPCSSRSAPVSPFPSRGRRRRSRLSPPLGLRSGRPAGREIISYTKLGARVVPPVQVVNEPNQKLVAW